MENNSQNKKGEENQEPNKEEIQKTLKENILQIFNQIKKEKKIYKYLFNGIKWYRWLLIFT